MTSTNAIDKKTKRAKKTLKTVLLSSLVALGCASFSQVFRSARAASVTLPIMVRLINAIELTIGAEMTFGTLAMTTQQGGSASLLPSNNSFIIDNNGSLALAGGSPQVGRINIKGAASPVTISLEDTSVQLTNGLASVTVQNFNILTDNAGHRIDFTPGLGQNSFTVPIGGTLVTKAQQPTGTYTGRTRIFVNFQ